MTDIEKSYELLLSAQREYIDLLKDMVAKQDELIKALRSKNGI